VFFVISYKCGDRDLTYFPSVLSRLEETSIGLLYGLGQYGDDVPRLPCVKKCERP